LVDPDPEFIADLLLLSLSPPQFPSSPHLNQRVVVPHSQRPELSGVWFGANSGYLASMTASSELSPPTPGDPFAPVDPDSLPVDPDHVPGGPSNDQANDQANEDAEAPAETWASVLHPLVE
jgi:hypothetical protein